MKSYNYNPRLNGNVAENPMVKLLNRVLSVILVASILICSLILMTTSTYYSAEVEGASMYPTINASATDDVAYYTKNKVPKKGDIIIVDYSYSGRNYKAIKRLIAVGGDTVCYYNGKIFVNGEALDEKYMQDDYNYLLANPDALEGTMFSSADDWLKKGYAESKTNFENWCEKLFFGTMTTIEKNTTFFKNYNQDYSGSVEYNSALSTYVLTLPENFVYFLGDNRKNSLDASILGPCERRYMLAKVDFITSSNSGKLTIFTKELEYLFA